QHLVTSTLFRAYAQRKGLLNATKSLTNYPAMVEYFCESAMRLGNGRIAGFCESGYSWVVLRRG
ncbi:MAG: hypothetical protein ACUVTH_11330, partial [Thermogutta sp.]